MQLIGRIPIVGFIDIPNVTEDSICDINYEIKNIVIRPNPPEEHSIYIEFEIDASCMAFERKQISLIQDLYCPQMNLEFTQKKIALAGEKIEKNINFTVTKEEKIPELVDSNILDIETKANLSNIQTTKSKITYTGEVDVNFIFMNSNTVNSKNVKIPFETFADNPFETEKINVETDISVENTDFNVRANGEVECKIELEIKTRATKNVTMNLIDDIEVVDDDDDDEEYNSLILYIAKQGDTLWKIAKRFNSTIDEIARMNGIEDRNKTDIGQKIYIPKFNYIRKERSQDAVPTINV